VREAGWERIHAELCRLAGRKNAYEVDEAKWLLAAWKARVHVPMGMGSFYEYVDRTLGYSRRFVAERLRVARALGELPALCAAVRRNEIPWTAAREISRVATPDTVDAWIETCRGEAVRDVERHVAGRRPGDRPSDPADDSARRHRVRFEVAGETLALLREARQRLLGQTGEHVSDDQLIQALSRALLERDGNGDGDPGRAAYQLAIHVCARCGSGKAEGGGELVPVQDTVLEAARCDAQEIGPVDLVAPAPEPGAAGVGSDAPRGAPESVQPESASSRDRRSKDGARLGATPCDAGSAHSTHVGGHVDTHVGGSAGRPAAGARAAQTIPPALRRRLVRRHQGRCAVPGCRQSGFVHQHHLIRRADGGAHDPETMCLLCEAHHRAVHEGFLVIEGRWSDGFRFRHADGSVYGRLVQRQDEAGDGLGGRSPTRLSRLAAAMRAVRSAGASEMDARCLVGRAATHVGPDATAAQLADMALAARRSSAETVC